MSRQLQFSSTIAVMVMAAFALSMTVRAQAAVPGAPTAQSEAVGGR